MVAFELFWLQVHRYGIFYAITFLWGYFFLYRLWKKQFFTHYPKVHKLLTDGVDDLVLFALTGVIFWWRLGHVFLYQPAYYLQNLGEIARIDQWWMSFIWWVVWVIIALLVLKRVRKMSWQDFAVLWDIILCIVPVGIFLWRIGNWLNQELPGKPLDQLSQWWQDFFRSTWLTTLYDSIDQQPRVFTNMIQAWLEWLLLIIVTNGLLFWRFVRRRLRPWVISWWFFVLYAWWRFFVEYFKQMPTSEYRWTLSITQRVMLWFALFWVFLLQKKSRS